MDSRGENQVLCPTCFTQIKKEDKTCAQCGEELDDLTFGYLSIPDQLEQYSSIHDVFLSKLSLITTGIIIALALIRNERRLRELAVFPGIVEGSNF